MKKYARIYNGVVVELFEADDEITDLFHPDFVWVEVTNSDPTPGEGWIYQDGHISPPPAPDPSAVLPQVMASIAALIASAGTSIAPLQDAVDLGMATASERELLTVWRQYRVALSRVEQQAGFPHEIEWPTPPKPGR